ncbi:MAG: hypothetical protein RJA57_262 [Bacteroidota bacterium]|jgi:MFS family permease
MKQTDKVRTVIAASSVGTMIEWYDFYIFGMLYTTLSTQFFPKENETAAQLSTLALFAAGFIVRPFGALVFGRLGDLVGRKYTFLLTLVLMGGSTFLIGCVPNYDSIGIAAPIIVLILRLVQGLALGGEYGGAATYVAEHAPRKKRGYYTSWIQTTATLGLFIALGVILLVKSIMSEQTFQAAWGGWRIPFWISLLLVGISIYIRIRMKESPLFAQLKKEGKTSLNPISESFRRKANFKMVLLALFGAVMGQGVIWYTSQFYAQNFLETRCQLDFTESRTIMLWAIALATPFFIVFGWLSDRIGRKWIMMAGLLGGILFYRPIFQGFLTNTDARTWTANPGTSTRTLLSEVRYDTLRTSGSPARALQHLTRRWTHEGTTFTEKRTDTLVLSFTNEPAESRPDLHPLYSGLVLNPGLKWTFIGWVWFMILFVTMVYGPIAAFLVEMFPIKIRYTSMSLPYHIGNGIFGGLVPFIGLLLTTTYPSDPLVGLWYPIGVATLCLIIGSLYLENRIEKKVTD